MCEEIFTKLDKVTEPAEITEGDFKTIKKFFMIIYRIETNTNDLTLLCIML